MNPNGLNGDAQKTSSFMRMLYIERRINMGRLIKRIGETIVLTMVVCTTRTLYNKYGKKKVESIEFEKMKIFKKD